MLSKPTPSPSTPRSGDDTPTRSAHTSAHTINLSHCHCPIPTRHQHPPPTPTSTLLKHRLDIVCPRLNRNHHPVHCMLMLLLARSRVAEILNPAHHGQPRLSKIAKGPCYPEHLIPAFERTDHHPRVTYNRKRPSSLPKLRNGGQKP
jgi:hypothetical protein